MRQLGYCGAHPSSRLVFSLEIPRACVIRFTGPLPGQPAYEPGRHAARRFGAQRAGQFREPVVHRCRLVIADVVDPGPATLDGRDRGRRGVDDVHQRPHPTAVADDRELPPADLRGHDGVRRGADAGPRAIEPTVAKRDALTPADAGHRLLQVTQRVHRLLDVRRRVRLDPAVLVGDRPAGALHPQGVALRHELADADGARGGQQVVGSFGAQPVGGGRHSLHVPKVRRSAQRCELMDDHLWLGPGHHVGHRVGVERVDDHRFGAERAQRGGLGGRAGRADDLVAAHHELGNELAADRTGRSGDEDLHDVSVRCSHQQRRDRPAPHERQ
ncbi:hypothetical protein LUX39_44180 [Actinomadura madurae]|nr:hypothetical protein [Actinomadura madurae]MCQ0019891.1 hypothetical protein [Actinomadura madurae]